MHRMIEEGFQKSEQGVLDADKDEFADFANMSKDQVYKMALEEGKNLALRMLSGKVYFKR